MSPRVTGVIVGTDRHGGLTVRIGDKLVVVPAREARRDDVHLRGIKKPKVPTNQKSWHRSQRQNPMQPTQNHTILQEAAVKGSST